jgi:hypothetical protein
MPPLRSLSLSAAEDNRLEEIARPWDDPDEEYAVLSEMIVPAALQRYVTGLQDWDAIDTKALGVLAAAVAALAALAAFHTGINHLWWLPAVGLLCSCALFAFVIRPYEATPAPDLLDLHDQMRDQGQLETARELLDDLTFAADRNDNPLGLKLQLFGYGLIALAVSLLGCIPVLLSRPH